MFDSDLSSDLSMTVCCGFLIFSLILFFIYGMSRHKLKKICGGSFDELKKS